MAIFEAAKSRFKVYISLRFPRSETIADTTRLGTMDWLVLITWQLPSLFCKSIDSGVILRIRNNHMLQAFGTHWNGLVATQPYFSLPSYLSPTRTWGCLEMRTHPHDLPMSRLYKQLFMNVSPLFLFISIFSFIWSTRRKFSKAAHNKNHSLFPILQ
jgi:hypothetical protein